MHRSPPAVKAFTLLVVFGWCLGPSLGRACSSFVLENNGYAVFGTNYDNTLHPGLLFVNKRGVAKHAFSADIADEPFRWKARYASVTFNVGGYQHAWAGMNERGLVLSTMALYATEPPAPDERPSLDWGPLWMQYILDTCATIEDVIAADALVRIVHTVDHYLVADRSGNAAVVELLDGEMVIHTGDDLPVKVLTNSRYRSAVDLWRSYSGNCGWLQDSEYRFCMVADSVSGFQSTTSEAARTAAFDTLDLVAGGSRPWNIVFDTEHLRAYFRTDEHLETRYVDLQQLDLRCQNPSLMLDIHEPIDGDLTNDLLDLSYEDCYDHSLQYLITQGDYNEETAELLRAWMDAITRFPCYSIRRPAGRRSEGGS
jgi:penicillin V acylase-like amidase (Ntn superfamily)